MCKRVVVRTHWRCLTCAMCITILPAPTAAMHCTITYLSKDPRQSDITFPQSSVPSSWATTVPSLFLCLLTYNGSVCRVDLDHVGLTTFNFPSHLLTNVPTLASKERSCTSIDPGRMPSRGLRKATPTQCGQPHELLPSYCCCQVFLQLEC